MIKTATPEAIIEAAEVIRSGGLVGMPTETVYGLAANAFDGKAVAKIFEAKGRPSFNPLITHVSSFEQAQTLGEFTPEALEAISYFWPGPLTVIVKKAKYCPVSELVTAGLDTIAIRMPDHNVAKALIEASGVPIAAPSANLSGQLTSTTPQHVAEQLGNKIDIILAAGQSKAGLESSILDLSTDVPVLLRAGAIPIEDLQEALGEIEIGYNDIVDGEGVKSPGLLQRHYAPSIPIRLNAVDVKEGEALLGFGSIKFMGVQGGGFAKDLPEHALKNLSETGDLTEAASNLFAMLHTLDNPKNKRIAVMAIPDKSLGVAINDRLKRAAQAHES